MRSSITIWKASASSANCASSTITARDQRNEAQRSDRPTSLASVSHSQCPIIERGLDVRRKASRLADLLLEEPLIVRMQSNVESDSALVAVRPLNGPKCHNAVNMDE
jgi:hypothetical protein